MVTERLQIHKYQLHPRSSRNSGVMKGWSMLALRAMKNRTKDLQVHRFISTRRFTDLQIYLNIISSPMQNHDESRL